LLFFDLGLLMMTFNVYLSHDIIDNFSQKIGYNSYFFSVWLRTVFNPTEINRILSHTEKK